MMLWCELHNTSGIKGGGITNFDPTEYEKDLAWLQTVTQVRGALCWLQKMQWPCFAVLELAPTICRQGLACHVSCSCQGSPHTQGG
jgi:hypothetical protein